MRGWRIVLVATVAVAGMAAAILAIDGATPRAFHPILRWTARTSLLLFLCAFTASSLRAAVPSRATRWLLDERRYLGVSFAVSHTIHLAAIVALARSAAEP